MPSQICLPRLHSLKNQATLRRTNAESSPDNRSECGSTSIFEQTSVNIFAFMSHTSLSRIAGKQCNTSKAQSRTFFHENKEKEHLSAANYIASTMHP